MGPCRFGPPPGDVLRQPSLYCFLRSTNRKTIEIILGDRLYIDVVDMTIFDLDICNLYWVYSISLYFFKDEICTSWSFRLMYIVRDDLWLWNVDAECENVKEDSVPTKKKMEKCMLVISCSDRSFWKTSLFEINIRPGLILISHSQTTLVLIFGIGYAGKINKTFRSRFYIKIMVGLIFGVGPIFREKHNRWKLNMWSIEI